MRTSAPSADGFTLIEVLVALAILGISLTVLMAIFSQVIQRVQANEHRTQARVLAQSLLAGASTQDRSGRAPAGLSWRLHVEPFAQANEATDTLHAATVSATIAWQDGAKTETLTLTTLKLVPKGARP